MRKPPIRRKTRQQLERYPNIAGRLQIKVLEATAINNITIMREVIEVCREFGVRFTLDDD